MAVSIVGLTDADLRVFANIPLGETMYTMGQVEARLGSITGTVAEYIASAVSTAWKAGGSITASGLLAKTGNAYDLLISGNEGKVYQLSEDLDVDSTTASVFVEPSGTHIEAGTDVAVINTAASGQTPVYKFNSLAVTDSSVVKSVNGNTPTNGAVTIPNAVASGQTGAKSGLMTAADKYKLDNISAGAEVNQNAFSYIEVSGQNTVAADGKTDTLTLVAGSNITLTTNASGDSVTIAADVPSGVVKSVTIPNGSSASGTKYTPDSSGNIDLAGVVAKFTTDDGNIGPTCGVVDIHGANGISVYKSGDSMMVDAATLSGVVSGLKNFSKITVKNSAGTTVTNGEITPASNADTALGFKAGSYVTLSTSGKNVVVAANPPVTDVKAGTTSFLSGTIAKIPTATSGALGLVRLRDGLGGTSGEPGWLQTAPTVNAVNSALENYVYGGDLHSNLLSSGLPYPESGTYASGTLYALIAALHASDTCGES